jgi:hypothetical protein
MLNPHFITLLHMYTTLEYASCRLHLCKTRLTNEVILIMCTTLCLDHMISHPIRRFSLSPPNLSCHYSRPQLCNNLMDSRTCSYCCCVLSIDVRTLKRTLNTYNQDILYPRGLDLPYYPVSSLEISIGIPVHKDGKKWDY